MTTNLRDSVSLRLQSHGWTSNGWTAVGSKSYDTAVGPKQAHAYLADYGPESNSILLNGDYQSEGRNQLDSTTVLIPRDADEATVNRMVEQFAKRVDAAVGQTYAARLLSRTKDNEASRFH